MANMPTSRRSVASKPRCSMQASSVSVSEWPRQAGAAPAALELGAQFEVVVDLAVERDDEASAPRAHRLVTGLAEVEDRIGDGRGPHRRRDRSRRRGHRGHAARSGATSARARRRRPHARDSGLRLCRTSEDQFSSINHRSWPAAARRRAPALPTRTVERLAMMKQFGSGRTDGVCTFPPAATPGLRAPSRRHPPFERYGVARPLKTANAAPIRANIACRRGRTRVKGRRRAVKSRICWSS